MQPAAGDHFENNDCSLTWTLGESINGSLMGENSRLSQGFPFPLISLEILNEETPQSWPLTAYPNPANNAINVIDETGTYREFLFNLSSVEGKKILPQNQLNTAGSSFDISAVPPGIYFLKVSTPDHKLLNTIRITKNPQR